GTVAAALNLRPMAEILSPQRIASAIGTRRLLLVLDNCEHLIGAAAAVAEVLLRATPSVSVLATSRELLRADGEYVHRVPPLALRGDGLNEDDVFRQDAVKLFVARARAAESRFVPAASFASPIAGICRRLDGLPLAIELAAARVASLGVDGIASRLDHRFTLLMTGKRT